MRTKLAQLIEQAVDECITYGRGRAVDRANKIDVLADWTEDGESIEIAVMENLVVRFTYTETVEL